MARYINADKLHYKRVGIVSRGEDGEPHCSSAIVVFAKEIDKAPTADVQEVKHGKWENSGAGIKIKACSRCNHGIQAHMACMNRFCPNCGAKMDLED